MSIKDISMILIQGPTGVGKSRLSLKIAEELQTDIISADSCQVYKFLDIGTAKPSKEEQKQIKHHLIDIVLPNEEYNAGLFTKDCGRIINELQYEQKTPLVTGGTGFYIKALTKGLVNIPEIPDDIRENTRNLVRNHDDLSIHKYLESIDPDSARRIHYKDVQKMLRAIEVWQHTGKTISQFYNEQRLEQIFATYNILLIEDRESLYEKINRRVDHMLDNGLIDEISQILDQGYSCADPGMITVGYREFFPYFEQKSSLAECIEKVKQNTRNYAKRQITWYRKQDFDLTLNSNDIRFSEIILGIKRFMKYREKINDCCES